MKYQILENTKITTFKKWFANRFNQINKKSMTKKHSIFNILHSIYRWCTATRLRKILSSILVVLILLTSIRFVFIKPTPVSASDVFIKFDEGYGTSNAVNDTNASISAGSITNAVWKTEDLCKEGKCLYFDGSGDYVSFSDDDDLDMAASDSVTIGLWFRTGDITSGTRTLISKYETVGSDGGYKITMNSDGKIVFGIDNNNSGFPLYSVTSANAFDDNLWHHLSAVKNGTTSLILYVDANHQGTTNIASTDASNNDTFYIGIDNGSTNGWLGFIDEVKITRSARTADQIKTDVLGATSDRGTSASFGPNQSFLSDGLVGYWKMDETSGNASDSSGNNLSLTNNGSATFTGGKFGNGANFDNIDDYFNITNDNDMLNLNTNSTYTWTFWARPNNMEEFNALWGTDMTSFGSGSFGIYAHTTTWENMDVTAGVTVTWEADGDLITKSLNNVLTVSTWNHIVVTYDGKQQLTSRFKIYVNGKDVTNTTYSNGTIVNILPHYPDGDRVKIGNTKWQNELFSGTIDEVRFYNRALSPAEVKALYEWAPGPVGYWKFDESLNSTIAYDSSGNGNDFTITGSPQLGYVPGKFGNAMDLSGQTPQRLWAYDSPSLSITGSLTLSSWIKPGAATADTKYTILGKWNNTLQNYLLEQYGDEIRLYLGSSGNYVTTTAANLQVGTWYYVSALYDAPNQSVKIFINGVEQTTTINGTIPSSLSDTNNALYGGTIATINTQNPVVSVDDDNGHTTNYSSLFFNNGENGNGDGYLGAYLNTDEYWGFFRFQLSNDLLDGETIVNAKLSLYGFDTWNWNPSTNKLRLYVTDSANASRPESTDNLPNIDSVDPGDTDVYPDSLNDGVRWPASGGLSWSTTGYNESTDFSSLIQYLVDKYNGLKAGDYITVWVTEPDGNNQEVGFRPRNYGTSSDDPKLDINYYTLTHFYKGALDELKIYNYARTLAQIVEDMNAGHPAPGSPVGSATSWWKFDEGYGTTANDSGTSGSNLTLSSASWTNNGKFGKAFDGGDNKRVAGTDDSDFEPGDLESFAISAWFKSDGATTVATEYLVSKGGSGAGGYQIYFNTSGQVVCGIDDDTTSFPEDSATTTADYYDQTWHHVTCVRDITADKLYLYIDGELKAQDADLSATGSLATSSVFYLGDQNNTNGTDEFLGDIDDVRFYRSNITSDQIKLLYNQGSSAVWGATSTDSSNNPSWSSTNEYCPPGQGSTCTPPVAELKFDEGAGITANDTSGNSVTGTLHSTAGFRPGKFGNALYLDGNTAGNDSHVQLPNNSLSSLSQGTISTWYNSNLDNSVSDFQNILAGYDISLGTLWEFAYQISDNTFHFYSDTCGATFDNSAPGPTSPAGWHHAAITVDSTGYKIYVDGILKGSGTTNCFFDDLNDIDDEHYAIGCYNFGSYPACNADELWRGYIDNFRIYNYALTPAQIAWDYNRGKAQGWWKLDENTGTTAYDSSGNGYNSQTFTGNTTWTTGKYNTGLTFDGTDDVVRITEGAGIDFGATTDNYSISAWFKTTTNYTTNPGTIVAKNDGSGVYPFDLQVNTSEQPCIVMNDGTTRTLCGTQTVNDGNWHLITAVRDVSADTITLYIDGNRVNYMTDPTTATMANNDNISIGNSGAGTYTTNDFNGQIDDVRIFNYNLNLTQVKLLYNESATLRFGPASENP